jgi:sulfotransferase
MEKKIFYNSSLPRSGSSLIQNIFLQRPDMYASPTSGLLELVFAARANYTTSPEFKAQDSELMKKAYLNFCKEGMNGFYNQITERPYVIDKSRGWGIHYGFLEQIQGEKPKVICMIRDLREIICSMEKNFRKSQHQHDNIVNHAEMRGTSTPKRVDIWMNSQPVGLAIERLNQILREGIDKDMLFVRFEDLCNNPKDEMLKIYNYLGIDYYEHDFNNVEQITKEDDEVYGIYGDHKIRLKVEPVPVTHNTILGPDVSNWIYDSYRWYFDRFNYRK